MTMGSETNSFEFSGNGSTTIFAFSAKLFALTDIKAVLTVVATSVETVQVNPTDFTVASTGTDSTGAFTGANVTFVVAPPTGTRVRIFRDVPRLQDLSLPINDGIPSKSLELRLDSIAAQLQRAQERLAKGLLVSEGTLASFTAVLPPLVAGQFPRVKSDVTGWEFAASTLGDSGVVAGTYGSGTAVPVFTVNAQGIVTAVTNTTIVSGTATITTKDDGVTETSDTNVLNFVGGVVPTPNGAGQVDVTLVVANSDVSASAAIAFSKLANVSATDRLLGRQSAGAGAIEEVTCTAAGRALLDDADAAAQRTTLSVPPNTRLISAGTGLTGGGDLSADRTLTLANTAVAAGSYGTASAIPAITVDAQGRITAASTNAVVITNTNVDAAAAIAFSKLANVSATDRLLGRQTAGAGAIEEITCTAAGRALIDDADAAAQRTTLGAVGTARLISAGTGLTGGGDLSADRTITMANTAVTPGTFGSSSAVAQITVDAQGRITAASSVAISSGTASINVESSGSAIVTTNTIDFRSGFTVTDVSGEARVELAIANAQVAAGAAITYSKLQNVSQGDRVLGRTTAAGVIEEIACTSAGRALIDDADASAQLTTLGFSTFGKTIIDDADASAALGTLGFSTFGKTIIDDADADATRTTLGAVGFVAQQVFTAGGTYTPRAGMLFCVVEAWGAGAGGGGVDGAATFNLAAAGGGAGGYTRVVLTAADIGASKAVVIGTAGAGGAAGFNTGSAGTSTTLGTTLAVALGGAGGTGVSTANNPVGGAGGAAGSSTVSPVVTATGARGGGGLNATITTFICPGGNGASSPVGTGGAGATPGFSSSAIGSNAAGFASGGGGAAAFNDATDRAGGNGTAGLMVITEYAAK